MMVVSQADCQIKSLQICSVPLQSVRSALRVSIPTAGYGAHTHCCLDKLEVDLQERPELSLLFPARTHFHHFHVFPCHEMNFQAALEANESRAPGQSLVLGEQLSSVTVHDVKMTACFEVFDNMSAIFEHFQSQLLAAKCS